MIEGLNNGESRPLPASISPISGIGYVKIPKDIGRDTYIQYCASTNTVLLWTEYYEQYEDVKVSLNLFNYLVFPENFKENGSLVFWVKKSYQDSPIIIGVLGKGDEVSYFSENAFSFLREKGGKGVLIRGNSNTGELIIRSTGKNNVLKVETQGENSILQILSQNKVEFEAKRGMIFRSFGEFTFEVYNEEDLEILKYIQFNSDGFVYEDQDKKITISTEQVGVEIFDGSKVNVKKDEVKVESTKIVLNGEKISVKNDTESLKNLLINIITQMSAIKVTTQLGVQPVLNKTVIEALKTNVNQLFE